MRFKKTKDGYLDTETGLIWKDRDEPNALAYEEALKLNDGTWRVPTIKELSTLIDYTKYDPSTLLPNIKGSSYWSSSPNVNYSDYAWYVNFEHGDSYYSYCNHDRWVRLVRDIGEK